METNSKFKDKKYVIRWIMAGIGICIIAAILWAVVFPSPYGISVRRIASMMQAAVIVAVLAIIAMFIYRAKKNKRVRIFGTILLSLLLIVVIVLNVVIINFHVMANQLLDRSTVTAEDIPEITSHAKDLTERLEEEGLVLLRNENEALPLSDSKINVLGYASANIVYGGSGSGAADETSNVTLTQALEDAGFEVNEKLVNFYKEQGATEKTGNVLEMIGGNYNLPEPTAEDMGSLIEEAKAYSDTALLVFGRRGGEGSDMPMDMEAYEGGTKGRHYLELTENEEALVAMARKEFGKVIVLINSSTPMELGFLEEQNIDAAMWIGGPGSTGLTAVAKALKGEVNPSGRLVDTYAYDITKSPAYYNAGDFKYLGSEHTSGGMMSSDDALYSFVNYQEGIYVGYRYYETAAADGFINYEEEVQYPFGYGLSYTSFEQKMGTLSEKDGKIVVPVTVTNTGKTAGKEVVQIYYTAPYTKGGIEKAHVVLAAFDKTELLAPGESETLTLEFAVEDMSSYDYVSAKSYVLEAGDYEIKLMKNSHDVIDSQIYTVAETQYGRESDLVQATNLFDDVAGDVQYMSRADWAGTMPKERAKDVEITEELMAELNDLSIEEDKDAVKVTVKKHGIAMDEMTGVAYDDPKWDEFLEQLSVKDMAYLIGTSGWQNVAIPAIKKPQGMDLDGPAGLNGLINGTSGNQYTSEVVMASTWNVELLEEFGEALGNEAYANGVSGLYGPAMNIHRTPFSGRNFEYYSEDGFLSGKMGAAAVRGAENTNTYTYIKHFALNDQETNAIGLATFTNEQAFRELYLRPFELAVKEGKSRGIMGAWSRVGTTWACASKPLMTDVLRGEWGFEGLVITDNSMMGDFQDADQAVAAGTDMMLASISKPFDESDTATGQQNMRKACHNILYVMANSNIFELAKVGVPAWIWIWIFADALFFGLIAWGAAGCTKPKKRADK